MAEKKPRIEEFEVNGDKIVETVIEIPLTFGVVGALLVPVLAAVGALAALVTKCTIGAARLTLIGSEKHRGFKTFNALLVVCVFCFGCSEDKALVRAKFYEDTLLSKEMITITINNGRSTWQFSSLASLISWRLVDPRA